MDYSHYCLKESLKGRRGPICTDYTGKCPCPFCLITNDGLQSLLSKRKPKRKTWAPRSLQLLQKDNERFVQSGGDLKNAKSFHNCIGEPFFYIPLTQVRINVNNVYKVNCASCLFVCFLHKVCLPGLHTLQGIFLKLFTLLENECHELDLKMGSSLSSPMGMSTMAYLKELSKFKEELDLAKDNAMLLDEMQTYCTLLVGAEDPYLIDLTEQCKSSHQQVATLVC